MNIYIFMLIGATILFSLQFVFNKAYQEIMGYTMAVGASFMVITSLTFGLLVLGYNGFRVNFNWYTILLAVVTAAANVGSTYVTVFVLKMCSMAQYTLYLMLGGMTVPFVYGLLAQGEQLTWQKVVCFIIIAAAMILESIGRKDRTATDGNGKRKGGLKGSLCLAGVFMFNGGCNIINIWHQKPFGGIVTGDSWDFTFWINVFSLIFGVIMIWMMRNKGQSIVIPAERKMRIRALISGVGYSLVHGVANVMCLIALIHVDASVQYPIITGGCIVLGAFVGMLFGEKTTIRKIVYAVITMAGTLVLTIP